MRPYDARYLHDLARRLRPDQKERERANKALRQLDEWLGARVPKMLTKVAPDIGYEGATLAGSFARGTGLRGLSDLDVVVTFSPVAGAHPPNAKSILESLLGLSPDTWGPKLGNRTLQLTSPGNEGFSIDLVPIIRKPGSSDHHGWQYMLDPRKVHTRWELTQRDAHGELLRDVHDNWEGPMADLARVLKFWQLTWSDLQPMPSVALEAIAWLVMTLQHKGRIIQAPGIAIATGSAVDPLVLGFNHAMAAIASAAYPGIDLGHLINRNVLPPKREPAVGVPLLQDPTNQARNLLAHMTEAEMDAWAKAATADGDHMRSFSEVFPGL